MCISSFPTQDQAGRSRRTASHAEKGGRRGTILLVDDDPFVLSAGKRILQVVGFDTLTASSGPAAIRTLQNHADVVVCVLLDLSMPKMDGIQTFQALREICPQIPIFLVSGWDEEEFSRRLQGIDCSGFIHKPYSLSDLSSALDHVLGGPGDTKR